MNPNTNVSAGVADDAPIATITPAGDGPMSLAEAARALATARHAGREPAGREPASREPPKEDNQADTSGAENAAPDAPEELPDEGNAAPGEDQPSGETETADPADDLPPIEPPRSWTQEEKDRFRTLPRELQAYLSEREQQRDRDLRTRQNEAAEQRKVLEAERAKAESARQQYDLALPALLQALEQQQAGEFADIRSMADVEKLARENSARYALWDAQQKKIAGLRQEVMLAQYRQVEQATARWTDFVKREDELILEKVPDLKDPEKAARLQAAAAGMLTDLGFTQQELGALWEGRSGLSLRDHRVQLLIRDGVRLREMQASAKAAQANRQVPKVQRPGAAQPRGASADAELSALKTKLERTGSLKDAAAYRAAQQRLRRA